MNPDVCIYCLEAAPKADFRFSQYIEDPDYRTWAIFDSQRVHEARLAAWRERHRRCGAVS